MSGHGWLTRVKRGDGPIYLALLDAMQAAIRSGELQPGDRLPPQRAVADALGVDITTVTRAYGEAGRRGWTEGAVGRGTFLKAQALEDDPGLVDLSMNLPPPPMGVSLGAMLREATDAILQRADAGRLMAYHPAGGSPAQQAAGAAWMVPCLGSVTADHVLVGPGAQALLASLLSALTQPGDSVLVEPLTYPGFKDVAAAFGLTLIPCPTDDEGLVPDALKDLIRRHAPRALYLVPTMQNPRATSLSLARRQEIARIAQASGLWILEDDPYGRLMTTPPPAVASFARDRTFYLATLSKCLSPGLRVAYLTCPSRAAAQRVAERLRVLTLMPSPLTAAVATRWVRDGTADRLLAATRDEAVARRRLAADLLPQATSAEAESIHVWLDLPPAWRPESVRAAALARSLSLVTADRFAIGPVQHNGMRISLGGPPSREVLADALRTVADLLGSGPEPRGTVV